MLKTAMAEDYNVDCRFLNREDPINVLAVDDDMPGMEFLTAQIQELGHNIFRADNGNKALAVLEANKGKIDVVLMDRQMPVLDGLTAVRRMKDSPQMSYIPVIMVTADSNADEMKEGIDADIFCCLDKSVNTESLRSVLSAAVREARKYKLLTEELEKHRASFGLIDTCKFKFHTLSEAESLAAFIANCFPDPRRVLTGLGEILINAVEHGNLQIGYDRKTELVKSGAWRSEVERLQRLPEHAEKFVTVTVAQKPEGIYIVIEDQGKGFEWKKYINIDPVRASDNHGRGIAQANTISFDKLTYNGKGNQAVGFVSREKRLDW